MLSYMSSKFSQEPQPHSHEPRAALFLNRFTKTLTIMYATNGLANILGISATELNGKSFYYCIQENCLQEAVRCLESAKANDSIAYLRFWYRDPRMEVPPDSDETMSDAVSSDIDDDEGGVRLGSHMDTDSSVDGASSGNSSSRHPTGYATGSARLNQFVDPSSRSSSGNSIDSDSTAADALFDQPRTLHSSTSSLPYPLNCNETYGSRTNGTARAPSTPPKQIELEAVVSCTSDGLVVILRAARPIFPQPVLAPNVAPTAVYANGLFASPWAHQPILPHMYPRPPCLPYTPTAYNNALPAGGPNPLPFAPSAISGPPTYDFMQSIREVAVFAWSLVGINGSLAQYSRGKPTGESQPPGGLPSMDLGSNTRPENPKYTQYATSMHKPIVPTESANSKLQVQEQWSKTLRIRPWGTPPLS